MTSVSIEISCVKEFSSTTSRTFLSEEMLALFRLTLDFDVFKDSSTHRDKKRIFYKNNAIGSIAF